MYFNLLFSAMFTAIFIWRVISKSYAPALVDLVLAIAFGAFAIKQLVKRKSP